MVSDRAVLRKVFAVGIQRNGNYHFHYAPRVGSFPLVQRLGVFRKRHVLETGGDA